MAILHFFSHSFQVGWIQPFDDGRRGVEDEATYWETTDIYVTDSSVVRGEAFLSPRFLALDFGVSYGSERAIVHEQPGGSNRSKWIKCDDLPQMVARIFSKDPSRNNQFSQQWLDLLITTLSKVLCIYIKYYKIPINVNDQSATSQGGNKFSVQPHCVCCKIGMPQTGFNIWEETARYLLDMEEVRKLFFGFTEGITS